MGNEKAEDLIETYDVLVIGAGPSGCTAARDLALAGWKVAVLEQNRKLGGPVNCSGVISIEAFERAVSACPETTFIAHAPGFWAHISGDGRFEKETYPEGPVLPGGKAVKMLREYTNLYADLSAKARA